MYGNVIKTVLRLKICFLSNERHSKMNPWAKFQAISELSQDLRYFAFGYNNVASQNFNSTRRPFVFKYFY